MPAAGIDVLIRGAGPVGCVAALALRSSHEVRLLESGATSPAFRPIVLSYASRLILERVGAWDSLAATTIETIHVSQAGAFGRTTLGAADAGVPALGYVVEYAYLLANLRKLAGPLFTTEDLPARCVVHAEGMSPDAEVKRYAQDGLVARSASRRARCSRSRCGYAMRASASARRTSATPRRRCIRSPGRA